MKSAPNVLMIGTGEYTTGFVHGSASQSDKGAGVVALSLFDLRRAGIVGDLFMAGTQGGKFPAIRRHLERVIGGRYKGIDTSFQSFPADNVERDPNAYLAALAKMSPGDAVIVFTPDDTHFQLSMAAVARGCHTLIAKPIVKTLSEHLRLAAAAREKSAVVAMEVHKRWDPIYLDARDRIRDLGDFSYFSSYMSQPKSQLDSFRAWAGKSSDINVDQAHRGYGLATDEAGFTSPNPLFMKYAPDARGCFAGQNAYGYRSIAEFIHAARSIRDGKTSLDEWIGKLATVHETAAVTAILEAGRRSLDSENRPVNIEWGPDNIPVGLAGADG